MSRFIQIHTLTSYPASLLNRDDVGFAKRIPFGGATRTRISSQCLKRHWRMFEGEHAIRTMGEPMSIRSRVTFEREIHQPLLAAGVDPALARATTEALMNEVLGGGEKKKAAADGETKAKAKAKAKAKTAAEEQVVEDDGGTKAAEAGPVKTAQVTVLGRPEIEWMLAHARAVCATGVAPAKASDAVKAALGKDAKKNLDALRLASGLDAALFGRMVTSDILSRGDAALHVAHAFTVHAEAAETDYFSAVDDLLSGDDDSQLGSGHIGTTELTTGLFYGYVVVDLPLLVSNIEGCAQKEWSNADRKTAAEVVSRLIHLVATVSPGAKLGSTAPHAYAQCVLVERGNAQPRTLANAFLKPVGLQGDLLSNAYRALAAHVAGMDGMYGARETRDLAAVDPEGALGGIAGSGRISLADLATRTADAVLGR